MEANTNVIKLKACRLSFPSLFTAKDYKGDQKFAYSATLLIPKGSAAEAQVKDAIQKVAAEKWTTKSKAVLTEIMANPQKTAWVDGDLKSSDGYAGNMVLSAKRVQGDGRPKVVDANNSPLAESDGKPYAGCFVNASVEIWAQDNAYGKGIRCTLRGVQFLRDGPAFSASTPISDDEFDDVSSESTADDLV